MSNQNRSFILLSAPDPTSVMRFILVTESKPVPDDLRGLNVPTRSKRSETYFDPKPITDPCLKHTHILYKHDCSTDTKLLTT